jgi:hypothetical protein
LFRQFSKTIESDIALQIGRTDCPRTAFKFLRLQYKVQEGGFIQGGIRNATMAMMTVKLQN